MYTDSWDAIQPAVGFLQDLWEMSIQLNFQSQLGRILIDLPCRNVYRLGISNTPLMELDLLSPSNSEKQVCIWGFCYVLAQSIQKVIVPFRLWKYFLKLTSDQAISPFFFSCLCFEDKGDEFGACVKCQADNGRERSVSFILSAGVTRRAWCEPRSIVLPHTRPAPRRIASSPWPRNPRKENSQQKVKMSVNCSYFSILSFCNLNTFYLLEQRFIYFFPLERSSLTPYSQGYVTT